MSQITQAEPTAPQVIISPAPGLRERKRRATHQRIADEAARLARQKGIDGTTIDEIAAAAQVARATFFRYFDAKETAVAEGFSIPWLTLLVDNLEVQPPELPAMAAVIETFMGFAGGFDADVRNLVLQQVRLLQGSPSLTAWTLALYVRYELAIAEAVKHRFADLTPDDARPRMVGALTMSAIRISLDTWLASGATTDLAELLQDALHSVSVN
ncbi:MAG: TetR family transcriptional regulator [Frankiales bacterium]|nr:TetR family transcriptional regulator [Frankiales bacterium]